MWLLHVLWVTGVSHVINAFLAPCSDEQECRCRQYERGQSLAEYIYCTGDFSLHTANLGVETSNLVKFTLSSTTQSNLPANAFGKLPLEIVEVLHQNTSFDKQAFNSISETLSELYLQNVSLHRPWDLEFLSNLDQLEILNLDSNGQYPEQLPSLMFSQLNVTSLRELSLSNCKIARVAATALTGLLSVERLVLSHNALSTIPNAIQELNNLRTLDLSHNSRVMFVDNHAFNGLHKLEEIDLSYTQISGIMPEAFAGLENSLRHLHLQHTRIEHGYFETMRRLRRLKTLDVSFNRITEMQNTSFVGFFSLEELNLCGQRNEGSSLDFTDSMFRGLEYKLRVLKLCNLDLTSLPLASLSPLHLLRHLDATGNNFETVYESFFYGIKAKFIDVSNCSIYTISEEAFDGLSPGVNISFDHNSIVNMSFIVATPVCQFRKLSILRNPLHCDCQTVAIAASHRVEDLSGRCVNGLFGFEDIQRLADLPITHDLCDLRTIKNTSSKCSYFKSTASGNDSCTVIFYNLTTLVAFLIYTIKL